MKLLALKGYNFVTYRYMDISFEEDDGESLFIGGDNRDTTSVDSNGSGKSLLYDAITWCPYDITVRGFSKDAVIGSFDKYSWVYEKWIDDEDRIIEITRYRKHPEFKNDAVIKIDGVDSSKVTTIKGLGTNQQIVKLLGMNAISFLQAVVFSKARQSVCEEKETGRKKLLSGVLNLDHIDAALEKSRKDKRKFEKLLSSLMISEGSINSEIKVLHQSLKMTIRNLKLERDQIDDSGLEFEKQRRENLRIVRVKKVRLTMKKIELERLKTKEKLNEDYKNRMAKIEAINTSLEGLKNGYRANLRTSEMQHKEAKKSFDDLNNKVNTTCPTCYQEVKYAQVADKLAKFKKIIDKNKEEIDSIRVAIDKTNERIKRNDSSILELLNHIDPVIERHVKQCKIDVEKIEDIIRKAQYKDNRVKSSLKTCQRLQKDIDSLRSKLTFCLKRQIDIEEKVMSTKRSLSIANFWIEGFGSKGIKNHIINSVLDFLEKRTNEYLFEITDGYIQVSLESEKKLKTEDRKIDKLSFNVRTGKRGGKEYLLCSMGERARVWLAVELALNDIIRSKIDLALVDEAFDGLDETGVKRVMKLIQERGEKSKIICISHNDNVKKLFHRKKVVVMENDESRIEAA